MTKPIMIDGVDVSECKYYTEKLNIGNGGQIGTAKGYGFCIHNIQGLDKSDCYARDYARCLNNDCFYKQFQQFRTELQRLKAENEKLKAPSMIIPQVGKLGVPIEQYCKLKQALEDVREITKKYYLSDKKLLATGIGINPYGAIIEIQDKINEVLKDE